MAAHAWFHPSLACTRHCESKATGSRSSPPAPRHQRVSPPGRPARPRCRRRRRPAISREQGRASLRLALLRALLTGHMREDADVIRRPKLPRFSQQRGRRRRHAVRRRDRAAPSSASSRKQGARCRTAPTGPGDPQSSGAGLRPSRRRAMLCAELEELEHLRAVEATKTSRVEFRDARTAQLRSLPLAGIHLLSKFARLPILAGATAAAYLLSRNETSLRPMLTATSALAASPDPEMARTRARPDLAVRPLGR